MLERNENRPFQMTNSIKVQNVLLDFSTVKVMGIVNLTPDSFYDGGKNETEKSILLQVEKHLSEGADIIDLGAFSSRPGAELVSIEEELRRLIPALQSVRQHFPDAIISVDTYRSAVVTAAYNEGIDIVNDISGANWDKTFASTVGKLNLPYILMHSPDKPDQMMHKTGYTNVVQEVFQFFFDKVAFLRSAGIDDIILDPGFGFGKTISQNYQLLANLELFKTIGCPILIGLSRKKMIQEVIQQDAKNALNGTTAAHVLALQNGANLLRVHDVIAAKEAISIVESYQKFNIAE